MRIAMLLVGVLRGAADTPVVALRADMDALPVGVKAMTYLALDYLTSE